MSERFEDLKRRIGDCYDKAALPSEGFQIIEGLLVEIRARDSHINHLRRMTEEEYPEVPEVVIEAVSKLNGNYTGCHYIYRLEKTIELLIAENDSLKEFARWYTAGVPEIVGEPLPEDLPAELPLLTSFHYSGPALYLMSEEQQKEALANMRVKVSFPPAIPKTEYNDANLSL